MKVWKREGYRVEEVEFDGDLREFEVIKNGEVIGTITPDSLEAMEQIIEDLNNGEDVDGWEDGKGGTIDTKVEFEVSIENVRNVLDDLEDINNEIVWKWRNDERYLNTFADDFNDLEEAISLEEYLTLLIEREMYDKK